MAVFGNQAAFIGSLGIATNDLFGHFNAAAIAGQGNPVPGGNLVSCSVYMIGPGFGQPNATVTMGVYTVAGGAPLWTLFAQSAPVIVTAASAPAWRTAPIAGVLVPGNSYATAVLSVHAGGNPSVYRSNINMGGYKSFIVPGVFPNPLGVIVVSHEWLLYTTYDLPDDGCPTSACCSFPHGNSNM